MGLRAVQFFAQACTGHMLLLVLIHLPQKPTLVTRPEMLNRFFLVGIFWLAGMVPWKLCWEGF